MEKIVEIQTSILLELFQTVVKKNNTLSFAHIHIPLGTLFPVSGYLEYYLLESFQVLVAWCFSLQFMATFQ